MISENSASSSKIVEIDWKNVSQIFEYNELVVIIFEANYNREPCKHEYILEQVAIKVSELYPDPGKVIIGKSYYYEDWLEYYSQESKPDYEYYHTVRLFINGKLARKLFSSDIIVSNIVSYIQNLLDNSLQVISSICLPNNPTKAYEKVIIGYFKNKNSPDYQFFKKLSMILMGDCQFYAGFGEEYCSKYPDSDHNKSLIIFKISNQPSPEFEQEIFRGDSLDFEQFYDWVNKNVLYSTSEITFDNAEEIQKDRQIYLILFYNPDDLKPVKRFKDKIKTDLKEYCKRINFLTANGSTFSKKLQEIEKCQTDLPFLLLVQRGVIYQFPENYDVNIMLSYQQLKTLIDSFFSNKSYYNYRHYYEKERDKSDFILPVYRFNLFCEFSNKPVKIHRQHIPDSADDNFCVSLFDE
ncbi:endoplasmic reticulum resident protein 44-like [Myzus persicae]|uniref:endoplasmic reticulum resident protein 44-like n=1 Tax=Myzus persicae TaxID=13164 RepID=UPI000B933952|nr:endoplasmic reticulum resident protein 44-like [Myzus persicae]